MLWNGFTHLFITWRNVVIHKAEGVQYIRMRKHGEKKGENTKEAKKKKHQTKVRST